MPAEAPPDDRAVEDPKVRWGMGDELLGLVIALVLSQVVYSVAMAATGRTGKAAEASALPLGLLFLLTVPMWVGYVGVSVYAAEVKGRGLVRDFRLRFKPIDLLIGAVVGVVCQYALVPVLTYPMQKLLDKSDDDVTKVAKDLADKAHGWSGWLLLFLMVAVFAPLVEELFFRGLVLRSIEKSWGIAAAIILSSLVFGLLHQELLQLPALTGFGLVLGLLVWKTDRLGTAMVAHVSFNTCTAVSLFLAR